MAPDNRTIGQLVPVALGDYVRLPGRLEAMGNALLFTPFYTINGSRGSASSTPHARAW